MNRRGKQFAIWGVVLQSGLVVGALGTIIAMVRAFNKLAQSETPQPEALAAAISFALYTTAVGEIMALAGSVFVFIALFGIRYRAPWFRSALWMLSILWLLCFPVGIIPGIVIIVYLVNHKEEFAQQSTGTEVLLPSGGR
ncbi:MAG: MotA/TolQ/ExbB proton channel family protein [Kiritimatiellae bacterium]|nr:MotA/TolQ/ExbB proton channel family protein [Kiritimatiellia bacterium]